MKQNDSFEAGLQFAWDATSLTLAQTCPRKYQLAMLRQITPREKSVHLIFGGFYASALERFYKLRAEGADEDEALLTVVRETLIKTWDTETNLPIRFDDPQKTRANLIRTIIWYVDQFGDRDNMKTKILANGKPAVELSFSIPISPDGLVYCGHLDRVVEFGPDALVQDQKTTKSTVGKHYFDGFRLDNQMSGYTLAGRMILESPVRGVVIDAAQIAVGSTRFVRGFTYRTEDQLNEWLDNSIRTMREIHRYTEDGYFPMNLTACNHYQRADGRGGCEFRDICGSTPGVREAVIKSEYESKVWDPLKRR